MRILLLIFCASAAFAADVKLAWDHDETDVAYRVEEKRGTNQWATVATSTNKFATITNVTSGVAKYRVLAYRGLYVSDPSNEVTNQVLATPFNLKITVSLNFTP